jgi:hypothetical protein
MVPVFMFLPHAFHEIHLRCAWYGEWLVWALELITQRPGELVFNWVAEKDAVGQKLRIRHTHTDFEEDVEVRECGAVFPSLIVPFFFSSLPFASATFSSTDFRCDKERDLADLNGIWRCCF